MSTKYSTIKTKLRKFSFEHLKASEEPIRMLEYLHAEYPEVIGQARNPDLLAAALAYLYVKKEGLGGRGGITVKKIGEYFGVGPAGITQKVFDLESCFDGDDGLEDEFESLAEFVDSDRFEANGAYWDFLESEVTADPKKAIASLEKIVTMDPDFYDPYISLYEYYLQVGDTKRAVETLKTGYERAMKRIAPHGVFPDRIMWYHLENRHIVRLLFNVATMMWTTMGEKLEALKILMQLLHANPEDNIGARYAIVALLEGYATYEDFEKKFEKEGFWDTVLLNTWFEAHAPKHKAFIGWWLEWIAEQM